MTHWFHRVVARRSWSGQKAIAYVMAVALVLLPAVASAAQSDPGRGPVTVFVSIVPQQYFVHQIAGNLLDVQVMVPPGASPHTYEPKPLQMKAIARAKLYLAIGVPFETAWLPRIAATHPGMDIIHTDEGIVKIPMTDGHDHGRDEEDHGHEDLSGNDPHIWLSPPLVQIMADHILKALVAADPDHQADYQRNHRLFSNQIQALDDELRHALASNKGALFMVFHPSWGYFAKAYGLIQFPIEVEGKAPKPAQLQHLIETARQLGVNTVLVQPQFPQKSARVIAQAIGGSVVTADPLALEWEQNLRHLAMELKNIAK